jgi:predicted unusual protein kinase regulating ubiquinone biosynthesis (AarF/ABC1/UbiB family)
MRCVLLLLLHWRDLAVRVAAARVPAYYALILRSLTVLEGLALQADANYKLLGRAYPYIARRLLTDPAPELRASFEDLVIKVRRCTTAARMCDWAKAACDVFVSVH